jgi:hypothetical protein
MLTERPRTTKRYLGFAMAIQGALLVGVSVVGLPAALRMAEILYAEDFDRSGVVPAWFAPWLVAMSHPTTAIFIVFVLGLAIVIAGVMLNKRAMPATYWLEGTMLSTLAVCLVAALALIPLANMGGDWPLKSPAYEVRRTVIASAATMGLQSLLLIATVFAIRRIRRQAANGGKGSEA